MAVICTLIQLWVFAVLLRIVLSWFPGTGEGTLGSIISFLYTITEPVLGPLRAVLPPVRMGAVGLDLSPIVVLLGASFLIGIIC